MRPIIIGAGPIGSNTARLIQKLNPILIESKKIVGKPVQCTGLMSTRLKEITRFPDELILNKIKGAKLFSKNKQATLKPNKVMAHVINRTGFDQWMLERYQGELHLGEKYTNYSNKIVQTSKRKYKTQLMIDCSGPRKEARLLGVQAVAPLKREQELVELHFDDCPGFFAWVVPVSDDTCRIGLASRQNSMQMLKKFLNKIGVGKVKEWNAGLIPMQVNDFVQDNYLRCGDAAGHVKAISGGGVVTGLKSSSIMALAILQAHKNNDYSKEFFNKHYYKPWSKSVGKELKLHARIRKVLNKTDYDKLISFIEKNKQTLERYGDMDYPSKFIFKLLKPRNLDFIIKSALKFIFA